ncbi:hypothetical protein C6N75_09820 [Streptomyces solincola]|uniref:Uncharacterized protein n=1 Tax=Streptomyces solincola TaxID=2100817 RepID=A0A2S9PY89_9ACTN|nr:hypothetical protein [Streptomyces solincola]PRH79372.1 hypothetical protein C6N75_09820 [Streptomyces solincola]
MTSPEPAAGLIFLARIEGVTGRLVWLLQAINGDPSRWTHVGVALGDGRVFEAQPGGAVISPWSRYAGREVAVLRWELTPEKTAEITAEARRRVGTPYNWTTYFYMAAYRLCLPLTTRWLRRRVSRSSRMICSQAADDIYRVCGIHLFNDGRLPHDVTPGDIARLIRRAR